MQRQKGSAADRAAPLRDSRISTLSTTERPNLRDLLERMSDGDDAAREEVYEHLYGVLRHRAQIYMSGQPPGHTLQPTALIHEAFLRMDRARGSWSSEACFLAVAAKAMRDALVDHARTKSRRKRKAQGARQPLEMTLVSYEENAVDILDLDQTERAGRHG